MKNFSEESQRIIDINLTRSFENQPDNKEFILKKFITDLKLALRFDYGYEASQTRKMNDNTVIEIWYKEHSKNLIKGA